MIRLGKHEFDDVLYDARADVLYLSKGRPVAATETIASPEGHAIRLDESRKIIGITVVNARWLAERDGQIIITIPTNAPGAERLETPASQLAEALAA